jgi:hypothetical protein
MKEQRNVMDVMAGLTKMGFHLGGEHYSMTLSAASLL